MEMMKRKAIKVALLASLMALIALAVGVTVSSAGPAELPEYLGSKACLGCHSGKFLAWSDTGHASMLTQVVRPSDLPGDISTAPEELKAELQKADWIVAGQRFLARDPQTEVLTYLNVRWDAENGQYVSYKGGSNWETGCAGCHSTGWDKTIAQFAEPSIGCEMCHGPGRDHVLGKGDRSKIVATNDAQVCGQCHTGGSGPNGAKWPQGYQPGEDLMATGFNFPETPNPHDGLYSDPAKVKQRQYMQWATSAHANAITSLESSGHASESCYKCHAAEAFADGLANRPLPTEHQAYDAAVSCTACHDPHKSTNENQLRQPKEQLCVTCHTASIPEGGSAKAGSEVHHPMAEMLKGYGAIGVAPTAGAHSKETCVECHMTEGNHQMRVITPAEVEGVGRTDTCTSCHANSTKESRQAYLDAWQDSVEARMAAARNDQAVIESVTKVNPSALSADLKAKFDAAKTNLSFVEADGSRGAHNFEYAIKVVSSAQQAMAEVRSAIGK